jgi:hypothetical protein
LACQVAGARESVEHIALDGRGKQLLLIVLAVDIGQMDGQLLEQRGRGRPIADKGTRLAAGLDFALDEQLAVLDFNPGVLEQFGQGRRFGDLEDPRDAGARSPGADHFRGGSAAQQ